MFRALRNLKVAADRTIQPGEMVPEADSWSLSTQRAHINMGDIEQVAEPVKPHLAVVPNWTCSEHPEKVFKSKRALQSHLNRHGK